MGDENVRSMNNLLKINTNYSYEINCQTLKNNSVDELINKYSNHTKRFTINNKLLS